MKESAIPLSQELNQFRKYLGGRLVMKIFQTSGSYHIVEYNNKRYVLDNTTIEPKKYYWGQTVDELSV